MIAYRVVWRGGVGWGGRWGGVGCGGCGVVGVGWGGVLVWCVAYDIAFHCPKRDMAWHEILCNLLVNN